MDKSQKEDFDSFSLSYSEEVNTSFHRPMSQNSSDGDWGTGDGTVFDISNDVVITSTPEPKYSSLSPKTPESLNNNQHNSPLSCGVSSPRYKRVRSTLPSLRLRNWMGEKGAPFYSPQLVRSRLFENSEKIITLLQALKKPVANQNLLTADEADAEDEQVTKTTALQNISRYYEEFDELALIGVGEFGSVYKCISRLDGIVYAVKRCNKPVVGNLFRKKPPCMKEVHALAALTGHPHVLRFFSAWTEAGRLHIQTEFCAGGSLADAIAANDGAPMAQPQLRRLVADVADGLGYMHSKLLVHMDIKPDNIFVSKESRLESSAESTDEGWYEDDGCDEIATYKIGDLGHVTSVTERRVEEGDCRYLSVEVLREDYSDLPKADVFALGVTAYEAGGGGPAPKNGPGWHDIRGGKLRTLPQLSAEFNALIKQMVDPDPDVRPSAASLTTHPAL